MADRWLNRLANVDIVAQNNGHGRKVYNFDYDRYDEEQFRSRYRLTKDAFRELLELIREDITSHNERGNPILATFNCLLPSVLCYWYISASLW